MADDSDAKPHPHGHRCAHGHPCPYHCSDSHPHDCPECFASADSPSVAESKSYVDPEW